MSHKLDLEFSNINEPQIRVCHIAVTSLSHKLDSRSCHLVGKCMAWKLKCTLLITCVYREGIMKLPSSSLYVCVAKFDCKRCVCVHSSCIVRRDVSGMMRSWDVSTEAEGGEGWVPLTKQHHVTSRLWIGSRNFVIIRCGLPNCPNISRLVELASVWIAWGDPQVSLQWLPCVGRCYKYWVLRFFGAVLSHFRDDTGFPLWEKQASPSCLYGGVWIDFMLD